MVKIFCDKCGEEIKDKYYTVNFYNYDVNPKNDLTSYCTASASSNSRDGMLTMLNSQKMYCAKCKHDIEKFINND